MTATWQVRFQSRTFVERSVFTTSETCAIRPLLIQYPNLPVYPPHVSISLALPRALLLGASYSATAYGLAAFFLQRAIAGFPVPDVPCFVTLGWCFTAPAVGAGVRRCPFEWLPCSNVRHGLNTVPFGLACQPLWQVVHTVPAVCAGVTTLQSHLQSLSIVTCSTGLPLRLRLTAFPSPSLARPGRADPRLPNARLGMVLLLHHLESKTFTYRDTQLSRFKTLPLILRTLRYNFERTGRTHRLHLTAFGAGMQARFA